ncbi:MAG TPA: enoyl-CoA hydratase-related protein [Pseudonocardia sp.]|nr:enoyl-CoA hydratase-related protein [Pseudonocardia sp.]
MPKLERDGELLILDLGDDENRFTYEWLAGVNAALDEAEAAPGPKALVTRARGKFFSNGLALDWLIANPDQRPEYLGTVHSLFARVLALPIPTVCAVQGHCFAAGAMLQLSHDFSVMRSDRGFWCLPEVDLGLKFTPGMNDLLTARLPKRTAHEAMTTGRRYGGPDAKDAGIVDICIESEEAVVEAAVEIAGPLAKKAGPALGGIKSMMYSATVDSLRTSSTALG